MLDCLNLKESSLKHSNTVVTTGSPREREFFASLKEREFGLNNSKNTKTFYLILPKMTRENPPYLEPKISLSYNVVIWMFYLGV